MNDINETARLFAHTLIENEKSKGEITKEVVLSVIKRLNSMDIIPDQKIDEQMLFEILISDLSIGKGSISLLAGDLQPWLKNEKANISFDLWNRYKMYLNKKDPSFPVNELDDFTDKILDKCMNPKEEGSWDRRGMVVGHVQSGKTSNYVGLINKATDAGYKIIIVIAGTISSLRRQTQERIDEGYIGRSSSAFINNAGENKITGVGNYKVGTDIYSLTSSYYNKSDEGDFSQSIANRLNIPIGNNPIVFVIKKNRSILENLIDWFAKDPNAQLINGQPKLFNCPALIIDDEADSASVNATNDINDIKTINRLIRTLLNVFDQNTFIGYTATPYANLFISQEYNEDITTLVKGREYFVGDDLFPKDFIVNIKAPKNYIGASKMFGLEDPQTGDVTEPLDIFRPIYPEEYNPPLLEKINKNNKNDLPEYLPKSLETAILSFIITCAIRRLRGHEKKHNSMLIHVALYVKWIDRVAKLVDEKVRILYDQIQAKDESLIEQIRLLFLNDYQPTTLSVIDNLDYNDLRIKSHTWEDVKSELLNASSKIDVRSVHGTRSISNLEYHKIEEIDYNRYSENGLNVIAIGGSRLARGITLEGLSVSYYLRTTKMYDSLMQMGRWFGYRPGYVDLCRLYTNERIFRWFNHITFATEEMRNDFDELTITHQKPKDFRLKVRNHHGLLTITSVAKLNWAKNINVSFSGTNPQTYQLTKTKEVIENNFKAFIDFTNSLGKPNSDQILRNNKYDTLPRYLLYRHVNKQIVSDFLIRYQTETPKIKNAQLSDYVLQQNEIKEWNVAIVSNTDERVFIDEKGGSRKGERGKNKDVKKYSLNWKNYSIDLGCSVRNQQIIRDGEYYLISKNQIDDTTDRQIDLRIRNFAKNSQIKAQRSKEKKALLLIYALDERGTPNVNFGNPIIGYSLHFPELKNEKKVSYTSTIFDDFDSSLMEDDDPEKNQD